MHLVHSSNRTVATSLDEIAAEIYDTVDRMVMRVGELLERAHTLHPTDWKRWVSEELPFGLDTARRFRMIYLAYSKLPPETLARCPKAWQAMFAIRHLDQPALEAALDAGELGPDTTVLEAVAYVRNTHRPDRFTEADVVAGRLMGFSPQMLSDDVLEQLRAWARNDPEDLSGSSAGGIPVT
jgi:hypothetical protein